MSVVAAVWATTEYNNAGGWPTQGFSQSSGIHDVWNLWIVYPAVAWALSLGLTWFAARRRPISEGEIRREIERQAAQGLTPVVRLAAAGLDHRRVWPRASGETWARTRKATVREQMSVDAEPANGTSVVSLYWIPLGAGGHCVRLSGRLYELAGALCHRRAPCDLYHSALEVVAPEGRFVIEMTPIPDGHGEGRGVVREGPVGSRPAGRWRLFRYEIRRWRDGAIPDADAAVASPVPVATGDAPARRLLELVPAVPALVWGRDELGAGEMWNSNSVVAWLLERAGIGTAQIGLPRGGRAPGWDAGVAVARRG
jgi:hypothetical protein